MPAFLFIGVGIISMINTSNKFLSICGIFQLIKLFLLYIVVVNIINSKKYLKITIITLLLCLLLQGILYSIQNVKGFVFFPTGHILEPNPRMDVVRLGGAFGNTPGMMASFFAAILPIAFSLLVMQNKFYIRVLASLASIAGILSLVLTHTRSSWGSFILCCFIFLLISYKRKWLSLRVIIPIVIVASILILVFLPSLSTRFAQDDLSESWDTRMNLNKLAWNMVESKPFIGIGINSMHDVIESYIDSDIEDRWIRIVHNQYLIIWAEMGTLGIMVFLWFLLATFRKGISAVWSEDVLVAPLSLGMSLGLLSMASDMALNIFNAECLQNLLWLFAGLISATFRITYEKE